MRHCEPLGDGLIYYRREWEVNMFCAVVLNTRRIYLILL